MHDVTSEWSRVEGSQDRCYLRNSWTHSHKTQNPTLKNVNPQNSRIPNWKMYRESCIVWRRKATSPVSSSALPQVAFVLRSEVFCSLGNYAVMDCLPPARCCVLSLCCPSVVSTHCLSCHVPPPCSNLFILTLDFHQFSNISLGPSHSITRPNLLKHCSVKWNIYLSPPPFQTLLRPGEICCLKYIIIYNLWMNDSRKKVMA